jgi:glyoxalase/bleomycin resistance protein/dioxygenase superfamily protein
MIQAAGSFGQIAYIVEDLEATIKHWVEVLGIGPFFLIDSSIIENPRYRGEQTDLAITAALSYSGSMCVEIIQQSCDSASVYREVMDKRGPGFHHWGVMTEDFDNEIKRYEAIGYPLAFSGKVTIGGRFAYMDSYDDLGGMVELIELTPVVKELFEGLQAAAQDWDGNDPVRRN